MAATRDPNIPADAFIIIIGAMKAGTTTLYSHLAMHPKICPARTKEPDYFLEEAKGEIGTGTYEQLWKFDPDQHSYVIEASTGYAKHISQGVPERIKAYGLKPKFLYVLRDPIKRIESDYNFMRRIDPNLTWSIDGDALVQCSDYMYFVDMYERVFGKGCLHIIDFDDLVQQPLETMNSVFGVLNLGPLTTLKTDKVENATSARSSLESKLMAPLRPLTGKLPDNVRNAFKNILRPVLSKVSSQPETIRLTEQQRERIHATLQPNMLRLAEHSNINVQKWGFEAP